jgi:hypothetical protein
MVLLVGLLKDGAGRIKDTKINFHFLQTNDPYVRGTLPCIIINFEMMVDLETFRKLALAFPGVEELPHFHLISFRFKKKIFATFWQKENRAMLKLSPVDQSVFCSYKDTVFFPVPGAWGKQGATFVKLKKVRKDIFLDALTTAYKNVAKPSKR